jgi:hypothetical protein
MGEFIRFEQDPANKMVYVRLKSLTREVVRGIRQAYYQIGRDLKAYAKKGILNKKGKSGTTYYSLQKRKNKKTGKDMDVRVSHKASAPGEFPANQTGELQRSVNFVVRGAEQLEFGAGSNQTQTGRSIGNAPYAAALELGAKNKDGSVRMEPRPYLIASIKATEGSAQQHFEIEIEKALNSK